ncbi:hypothetical protein [Ruoffia tabacinasalis]|uniref:hypothetical protein n=1 Tax=Ruoffia tabacinasalis TaxID=87458 RepID=UPI0030D13257
MDDILKTIIDKLIEDVIKNGPQLSVTQRVKGVKQPWGGYLKRVDFDEVCLGDGQETLHENENVHASLIGMAVDYMARFMMGSPVDEAFKISLIGAKMKNKIRTANKLKRNITGLDGESIVNAIKLSGFDVVYRNNGFSYVPVSEIKPDQNTIENVRTMIQRTLDFFNIYGPVTLEGFDFEGAYTRNIASGDGDFLTEDTLWDLKVLKGYISKNHTLQLLVYWRMGLRTVQTEFQSIRYLGIYNPRKNTVHRLNVDQITEETIKIVDQEIIGYPTWLGDNGVLDRQEFVKNFRGFLRSSEHKTLITGLDDDEKIRAVLKILSQQFKSGIIYCSELGAIAEIINHAFDNPELPQKVNSSDTYDLGGMKVRFSKYIHSKNPANIGKNVDFVLYFPVETVLMNGKEKYLKSLLKDIKNTTSTKVIVMTTNDELKNLTPIREAVDSHIHYESEHDNPDLLEIIKSNFGEFEYPLFL